MIYRFQKVVCHFCKWCGSWSVKCDLLEIILRISDRSLAVLVGFDRQTGANFVHCPEVRTITNRKIQPSHLQGHFCQKDKPAVHLLRTNSFSDVIPTACYILLHLQEWSWESSCCPLLNDPVFWLYRESCLTGKSRMEYLQQEEILNQPWPLWHNKSRVTQLAST